MENYLMLNGKRIDLTEEQIRTLGFEVKKDYFKRNVDGEYFFITPQGNVTNEFESNGCIASECRYKVGNYCTNEEMMKQRALHETLDRLLWRFSMQNEGDKIDWGCRKSSKYYIFYDCYLHEFKIDCKQWSKNKIIYFNTEEIACRAIDEIVKPFMEQHPEFVW